MKLSRVGMFLGIILLVVVVSTRSGYNRQVSATAVSEEILVTLTPVATPRLATNSANPEALRTLTDEVRLHPGNPWTEDFRSQDGRLRSVNVMNHGNRIITFWPEIFAFNSQEGPTCTENVYIELGVGPYPQLQMGEVTRMSASIWEDVVFMWEFVCGKTTTIPEGVDLLIDQ